MQGAGFGSDLLLGLLLGVLLGLLLGLLLGVLLEYDWIASSCKDVLL